jgi:hypothetical protein
MFLQFLFSLRLSKIHKYILVTIIMVLFQSCRSDSDKSELSSVTSLPNSKLFVETYTIIGGGAGGGDRVSEYLTDKSNFSMYVGTFVQGYEFYSYRCYSDSVRIYKIKDEGSKRRTLETKSYFIPDLQKTKRFD